ncbi:MAG TPA: polysaccharide deacetylase family protein [Pyrinomonadaceae bacterium]|nr:polysaccharide deacetylase family protein [Pyrinomonadaceae bacterium]
MLKLHRLSFCAILLLAIFGEVYSQQSVKPLVERLGYPANTKLLIVHADDLGMAHSINDATVKAFATGLVNSGSIMIPCSWVPEIAEYARKNPQADLGLHLTLTSEWKQYRWGPLSDKTRVPSLVDSNGYLFPTESEASARAKVEEVEFEIRAQIEQAKKLGIIATHLDSHMGTLYQSKELFETFLKVARDNKLPVRMSKEWFSRMPFLPSLLKPEDVILDHIITIEPDITADGWAKFYADALKQLQPGVTEFVIHIAHDDEEMQGVSFEHPNWGAAWRQRDFDFFTSDAFRKLLDDNQIKLITWRDLQKLISK